MNRRNGAWDATEVFHNIYRETSLIYTDMYLSPSWREDVPELFPGYYTMDQIDYFHYIQDAIKEGIQ